MCLGLPIQVQKGLALLVNNIWYVISISDNVYVSKSLSETLHTEDHT